MSELGEQLLDAVERDFTSALSQDRMISKLRRKIDNGGTWADAEEYAARLGELKSRSLQRNITAELLPEGRMSRELAEEILTPTLTENYRLALEAAAQVQEGLNEAAGLRLKAVRPQLNTDRIEGISARIGDSESFEDVSWLLGEPVVNFTQSVADETLEENVEAHAGAGLSPKIERIAEGNCCKWCAELEGEWDYGDQPSDIYRRHENCRCQVLYKPVKGPVTDAHTKKQFETERDARIDNAKRIERNSDQNLTPQQRENRAKALALRGTALELGTGERFKLVDGERFQDKEVFAGKGAKTPYRKATYYAEKYGGKASDWMHAKGYGQVETADGVFKAELHWSELPGFGKVEIFIKEWLE